MSPSLTEPGQQSSFELVNKIATSPPSTKKRLRQAQKKIRIILREQCRIAGAKGMRAVALTLTYGDNDQFAKSHLTRFIDRLRAKLKRLGNTLQYIWTLEKATALHYHLILWLPRGLRLTCKNLESWWPWGSTWIAACKCVRAWTRYISKKKDKEKVPTSARIFGYGGLDLAGKEQLRKAEIPRWLRPTLAIDAMPARIHGAWIDIVTGEIFECPWCWTGRGFKLRAELAAG